MIVADDSALFRAGLVRVLESGGLDVVGQAGDAEEVYRLVAIAQPELVVLDIRMPPTQTTEGLVAATMSKVITHLSFSATPRVTSVTCSRIVSQTKTSSLTQYTELAAVGQPSIRSWSHGC